MGGGLKADLEHFKNNLFNASLASELEGAPIIVHVLCIWTLPVWRGGSKHFPGLFVALIYLHNGDFANFLKLGAIWAMQSTIRQWFQSGCFSTNKGCWSLLFYCWLKIWSKLWNLVILVKSGQNCERWGKLQNLVKIMNSGQYCELWSILWNLVNIVKSGQN